MCNKILNIVLIFAIHLIKTSSQMHSYDTDLSKSLVDSNDNLDQVMDIANEGIEIGNTSSSHEIYYRANEKLNEVDNSGHDTDTSRVMDEDDKSISLSSYPYAASVLKKGFHYATASLLSKQWLITAAKDFYNIRESKKFFKVRMGSIDCKRGGALKPLAEIMVHPDYVYDKPRLDVALLRIASPVNFRDNIKPIALNSDTDLNVNGLFLSTYWPRMWIGGRTLKENAAERIKKNRLRVSKKAMLRWSECYLVMDERDVRLDNSTGCFMPFSDYHSTCAPDGGAPVVVNGQLWGVISPWISSDCMFNTHPTIITRVSMPKVQRWIADLMFND